MNMHPDDVHSFPGEDTILFGSFQLNITRRILASGGAPIKVGSRALEILLALTEKAGAILSNRDLLQRVWPNNVVEDGTVRVHITLLRKVLRQAEPGSDYVHNVPGRGYRFAAPVMRQRLPASGAPTCSSCRCVSLRSPEHAIWWYART